MWTRTANRWKLSRNVTLASLCLYTVILGEPISAQTHVNLDTHASAEYADFIRAIAVPTALAETPPGDFVKFLRIGKNENGEVVVRGIGLLPINSHAGADPAEMVEVLVIAHVHHRLMNQAPVKEDALTVRGLGVPNFVISSDGRRIWEVGIVGGKDMYRDIGSKKAGAWMVLE